MLLRFEPVSRPAKRNCKLGVCHRPAKLLIRLPKAKWVPNGPSERRQRKPGIREGFRASGASPRCTAIHKKPPNSWLFRADQRTERLSRTGHVGGGKLTGCKHSFRWASIEPTLAELRLVISGAEGSSRPSEHGDTSVQRDSPHIDALLKIAITSHIITTYEREVGHGRCVADVQLGG
jgi:hypothetical protein